MNSRLRKRTSGAGRSWPGSGSPRRWGKRSEGHHVSSSPCWPVLSQRRALLPVTAFSKICSSGLFFRVSTPIEQRWTFSFQVEGGRLAPQTPRAGGQPPDSPGAAKHRRRQWNRPASGVPWPLRQAHRTTTLPRPRCSDEGRLVTAREKSDDRREQRRYDRYLPSSRTFGVWPIFQLRWTTVNSRAVLQPASRIPLTASMPLSIRQGVSRVMSP